MTTKDKRHNQDTTNPAYLDQEVRHLHRCLFSKPITETLVHNYIRAHQFIQTKGTEPQFQTITTITNLQLDAEAIEIALRRKNTQHVLLQKIKILTYLHECESGNYHTFVNDKPSIRSALLAFLWHPARAAYKMLKGKITAKRYRLV